MTALKQALGLPMLTFYGTGMILGAGIYSIIGKAAGVAQEGLWIGLALAALVAFLTALSYAELATMFPKAGAEYIYMGHAFPKQKWMAVVCGGMMAFGGTATATTVAMAFAGYMQYFVSLPTGLVALVLLMLFTGVNLFGIKEAAWANVLFTLIEIGGLALFIYVGLKDPNFGEALAATPGKGTLASAALVIFAYFGFENIANLAEEAKEPEKNVPRAIILSLVIATTLYLLVAIAAVALVPPEQLAQGQAALTDATKGTHPRIASVLGGIALFATANTALIALVTTSRILFGMAREKDLPGVLAKVSSRRVPWFAALVAFASSALLLPLGKMEVVASVSAFATMMGFLAINLATIRLRFTHARNKRAFRTPLSIGRVPILPVLGIAACAALMTQFEAQVYVVGGGLLAILCLLAAFRPLRSALLYS